MEYGIIGEDMEKEYLLEYDGKIVKCVIQKAKIKNIYMKVRNSIVEVRIPIRVSYERGIELIDSKRKWIFEALERANNHEDRHIDLKHKEYISNLKSIFSFFIAVLPLKSIFLQKLFSIKISFNSLAFFK